MRELEARFGKKEARSMTTARVVEVVIKADTAQSRVRYVEMLAEADVGETAAFVVRRRLASSLSLASAAHPRSVSRPRAILGMHRLPTWSR